MLLCDVPAFIFLSSIPYDKLCCFSGWSLDTTLPEASGPTGAVGTWHVVGDVSVRLSCATGRRRRHRRMEDN